MEKATHDLTLFTVGWFTFACAPVGLTSGQTLRLTILNLSPMSIIVLCGLGQNPRPLQLLQDSHTIGPGEAHNCDLKASDLPKEIFDKTGRAQIRAFLRSSSGSVCSNVEVFDTKTGRTSFILSLQEMAHRE